MQHLSEISVALATFVNKRIWGESIGVSEKGIWKYIGKKRG